MRALSILVLGLSLRAEPPVAQMKQNTVLILKAVKNAAGERAIVGSGSGFLVTEKFVATNWHVCCRVNPDVPNTEISVFVVTAKDQQFAATVKWSSEPKDLAVLEVQDKLPRQPVTVATGPLRDAQPVWAVGFPGASSIAANDDGRYIPTVTQGIISKMFRGRTMKDAVDVSMLQTTAAVNPGNSGGPLFDDCGRLIGINSAKALTTVITSSGRQERVPLADGINWAIHQEELLAELNNLKIAPVVAATPCVAPTGVTNTTITTPLPAWMIGGQVSTAVLALAAVGLAMNRRVREKVGQQVRKTISRPRPAPAPAPLTPALKGVAGYYAGSSVPLEGPLILGRDQHQANIVFPPNLSSISKLHCRVARTPDGKVTLEDLGSSNGTFLASGLPCRAGQPVALAPGDRFYLGSISNMFEIELVQNRTRSVKP